MKVLLIYPTAKRIFAQPSLGIMYIASVLRNVGHEVNIIEGDVKQLKNQISSAKADIIGITCMTPMYRAAVEVINYAKNDLGDIPIIVGGAHASIMPETLLENPNVDCVVKGEAEKTIVEILDSGIEKRFYEGEIIKDLDSIPFPARDLIDRKYFSRGKCSIIGSRGCPRNCSFCQPTLRKIFGNKVRYRTPENVYREMLLCNSKYKATHFEFFDDSFTSSKDFIHEFCNLVTGSGMTFTVLTRTDMVDYELLSLLKAAGLRRVAFGIESGSQRILNDLRKGTTVEQNFQAIQMCKDIGIKAHAFFMVGNPNESKETIEETKEFIKKSRPDTIYVSMTTPFPHTYLYDDCIKQGLIKAEDWEEMDCDRNPAIASKYLSKKEVLQARYDILRSFYRRKIFNPAFVYGFLKSRTLSYTWNVVKHVFGRKLQ